MPDDSASPQAELPLDIPAAEGHPPQPPAPPRIASGLAIAAAIVAFGFIGSRLLGILRTVAIADAFGAAPELDAYRVAFLVPDIIFQVLAGATLGSAFIPVFARLYRRDSEDRAWQLASAMLNLVTAATAALCIVAFLFAPLIVPVLAPGLGDDIGQHEELTGKAVSLTRLMLLSPFLFAVSGMVTGILNARQRFLLPALAPMLYNLAIIFGAVVLADHWGIEGLAAGVVIGAGLHLGVQVPGLVRERMRYRAIFDWRDAAVREVGRLMAPRVLGLAALQLNLFVTIFFASKVGSGAIAAATYAVVIAQLPLGLFGMAFSTAAFPRMADQVADGDFDGLRITVSRVLRVIMFLTVPAAIGLALLREPVTVVLLERGAFTSADSALTAGALGFYCLGIIPQAGIEIHSRGFYALGDTRTPVVLTILNLAVNAVLSALLWERFELQGLAFAVSAASWVEWLLLAYVYSGRTGATPIDDASALAKFACIGAAMAVFVAVAFVVLEDAGQVESLVTLLAAAAGGAAVYLGFARWLNLPEAGEIGARVRSVLRRG
jgi:putative peptidoglycan lipid II flippase